MADIARDHGIVEFAESVDAGHRVARFAPRVPEVVDVVLADPVRVRRLRAEVPRPGPGAFFFAFVFDCFAFLIKLLVVFRWLSDCSVVIVGHSF